MENPVRRRFGDNLRDVRKAGGVGQGELAERLRTLGVPMQLNTISRMENGTRAADVVELLALAIALGVTPNRLLLTGTADPNSEVALTPSGDLTQPENAAWVWAAGGGPIYPDDLPEGFPRVDDDDFVEQNRPHQPPNRTRVADFDRYREQLAEVTNLVRRLHQPYDRNAVPRRVLAHYLTQAAYLLEIDELADEMDKNERGPR